jgi:hypothetical protein
MKQFFHSDDFMTTTRTDGFEPGEGFHLVLTHFPEPPGLT